jgi:hypothetical protein
LEAIMSVIRLRFVDGGSFTSDLIELREGTCMPFTPSHVECVDGDNYIGQHMDGGMKVRHAGYDAPFRAELFVDLPCTPEQQMAFYKWAYASLDEPYDWRAIIGFAFPGHLHEKFHAICSAKMFLGLRHVNWFPSRMPLCVPAHCVDPRDLLFVISAIVEVPH